MRKHGDILRALLPPAVAACACLTVLAAEGLTQANRILDSYRAVQTVSCSVRKTTSAPGSTVRMLSRVFYKSNDCINVENVAPSRRRIVADGNKLYYHEDGVSKGFSKPVAELDGEWLLSLKTIPGTAMEHLLRIKDCAEKKLPASEGLPMRAAYTKDKVCIILACDDRMRLCRIEFRELDENGRLTAAYEYSDFLEVSPECHVPRVHRGTLYLPDGSEVTEVKNFDNLEVNKPVAEDLFDASLFFKDVKFVDEFQKTLE